MKDSDILVPKVINIEVGDRNYEIGKLKLMQTIKITQLLAETILTSQEKLAELKKASDGSTSNFQDFMSMLGMLEEQNVIKLFSILLNEPDLVFLKKNLELENTSEIVAIIFENNNIDILKKNYQRITKAMAKEKKAQA